MDVMRSFLLGVRALLIAAFAGGGASAQQPLSQEEADWQAALTEGTPAAFQRYLERHPTGAHAEEAFSCTIEAEMCGPDGFDPSFVRGPAAEIY
jgi:hypothetical protein